jgi:predicted RNase H-like nuclease
LLGPRRSSVFRVPCRATLEATNYDDAKIINKAKTGKSLAIQSWSIIPKIRELDEFLNKNISSRSKIREIHPEVCFYALNGGKPMEFNKKKAEGFQERIKVLRRVCDYTDKVIQLAKRELYGKVADDDRCPSCGSHSAFG